MERLRGRMKTTRERVRADVGGGGDAGSDCSQVQSVDSCATCIWVGVQLPVDRAHFGGRRTFAFCPRTPGRVGWRGWRSFVGVRFRSSRGFFLLLLLLLLFDHLGRRAGVPAARCAAVAVVVSAFPSLAVAVVSVMSPAAVAAGASLSAVSRPVRVGAAVVVVAAAVVGFVRRLVEGFRLVVDAADCPVTGTVSR